MIKDLKEVIRLLREQLHREGFLDSKDTKTLEIAQTLLAMYS